MGLKENVIIGHLIPAGTGIERFQRIEIVSKMNTPEEESPEGEQSAEPAPEPVSEPTEA